MYVHLISIKYYPQCQKILTTNESMIDSHYTLYGCLTYTNKVVLQEELELDLCMIFHYHQ
jgi:hypothetical protein